MTVAPGHQNSRDPSVTIPHRTVGRTHTESLAWAMFVAGYDARIDDAERGVGFPTRASFDEHLYEQFRSVYGGP
jgi:hypothetical protein